MYYIYKNLPVYLQNLLCTIYGYVEKRKRFGKVFKSSLDSFVSSDFSTKEEIEKIKLERLKIVLKHGKKSNLYPFLDDVSFDDIDNNPYEILENMPILSKDELREFYKEYSGENKLDSYSTSGTTGKALKILRERSCFAIQWAIWFRHRSRFGVKFDDISVNFTGKPVVPIKQSSAPYWRYNAAINQYLVSMQHINSKTIHDIVDFLNSIRPDFYSGYPSVISEVARYALQHNLKLRDKSTPRVVFTGAEKLLGFQQKSIKEWLGDDVILTDQYGLTEGNCNFSKCEDGNYHEDFEFCHIEVIDSHILEDGSSVGRLIGTAFYNLSCPIIRYDTGDMVRIASPDYKCSCGRGSRVILSVDGRVDDSILLPDGERIMRLDYLFKNTSEIIEAQVIQDSYDFVTVLAVLAESENKLSFESKVISHFKEYIHPTMEVRFKYTDHITRTSNGKFKAVINNLG